MPADGSRLGSTGSMIGRATKSKPTVREFVERLNPPACDFPVFRVYYCTLRRRGLAQTAAVAMACICLDYEKEQIAAALGCDGRQVRRHWEQTWKRFDLRGPCGLLRFVQDADAWPKGRRSKPKDQHRPFVRPVVGAAGSQGRDAESDGTGRVPSIPQRTDPTKPSGNSPRLTEPTNDSSE